MLLVYRCYSPLWLTVRVSRIVERALNNGTVHTFHLSSGVTKIHTQPKLWICRNRHAALPLESSYPFLQENSIFVALRSRRIVRFCLLCALNEWPSSQLLANETFSQHVI